MGETIGKNQCRVGWWGRPCFGRIKNTEGSPKLKLDMHSDLENYFDRKKHGQKLHWYLESSATTTCHKRRQGYLTVAFDCC